MILYGSIGKFIILYDNMHKLEFHTVIEAGIDPVWDFFSSPENLSKITPEDMGFIITDRPSGKIYPGAIISYKVKPLLKIPLTWVTEITQVKEKEYFIDEQRVGPYRMWHHQHFFEGNKKRVEMKDIIHYSLPLGPVGKLAHMFVVKKKLERIFKHREWVIQELFGNSA